MYDFGLLFGWFGWFLVPVEFCSLGALPVVAVGCVCNGVCCLGSSVVVFFGGALLALCLYWLGGTSCGVAWVVCDLWILC